MIEIAGRIRITSTGPCAHQVSWYQARPEKSLELIRATGVRPDERVIDIGCGASLLIDALLDLGYDDITLLDLSGTCLQCFASASVLVVRACNSSSRMSPLSCRRGPSRSGTTARCFTFSSPPPIDVVMCPRSVAPRSTRSGGHVVIATFGPDGPERCSGLPTVRYDAQALAAQLGEDFTLVESLLEEHATPSGRNQQFLYCRFRRGG